VWNAWKNQLAPPSMLNYAEAPIDPVNRHFAAATSGIDVVRTLRVAAKEVPPISQPGGRSFDDPDGLGSLGPRQAYVLPQNPGDPTSIYGYTVDVTDCFVAPGGSTAAGSPIGGPSGGLKPARFYCVLTARARLQLPDDGKRPQTFRTWSFGGVSYVQDM